MRHNVHSLLLAALLATNCAAQASEAAADYLQVTQERAAKITATLHLTNSAHAARVTDLIAAQYRGLSRIHEARDARIASARTNLAEQAAQAAEIQVAREQSKARTDALHQSFLAALADELNPEQVEQVKDGMTYGVAPGTYRVYMKMYPTLTDPQKKQVLDWLHEARELAMDEGDSKAKHAVFGKYKGRINNYLVKQGYDLKQGERNLRAAAAVEEKSK